MFIVTQHLFESFTYSVDHCCLLLLLLLLPLLPLLHRPYHKPYE